jgi:hypothetical protein
MNWRRGLLRLWFVLSLCWIAGVGLSSSREFVFEDGPDTARDQQSESLEKIINSLNAETAKQYALLVLVPPLATLVLGLLSAWVVSSFERKGTR